MVNNLALFTTTRFEPGPEPEPEPEPERVEHEHLKKRVLTKTLLPIIASFALSVNSISPLFPFLRPYHTDQDRSSNSKTISSAKDCHSEFPVAFNMHSTSAEPCPAEDNSLNVPSSNNNAAVVREPIPLDCSASTRFHLPKKKRYAPQYAHIYFCRLTCLRQTLLKSAEEAFGPSSDSLRYANRIVDASDSSESAKKPEAVVCGIVFRQMSSKPSILSLYDQPSHDLIPPPPDRSSTPYLGENDQVFLEDENGRCTLDVSSLHPLPHAFVTGYVIAVRGVEDRSTGAFRVISYASILPAPQPSLPFLSADRYLCVVSSLHLSSSSFETELFLEFLKGSTGDDDEEQYAAKVGHVLIAGNIVPSGAAPSSRKPLSFGEKERAADPIVEADRFLSSLASAIPVSVMPGNDDPSNHLLPQQPFHRCLLPSASRNSNLSRVSNPYSCSLGGRLLLATSGQNVTDFALYQKAESHWESSEGKKALNNGDASHEGGKSINHPNGDLALDIMESMLTNRHIAPTCPDTLGAYPFYEQDPFTLDSSPHIFLAGNQNEFATRTMTVPVAEPQGTKESLSDCPVDTGSVRLVSVPRFDRTGQAVFINLRTLNCSIREFALSM